MVQQTEALSSPLITVLQCQSSFSEELEVVCLQAGYRPADGRRHSTPLNGGLTCVRSEVEWSGVECVRPFHVH